MTVEAAEDVVRARLLAMPGVAAVFAGTDHLRRRYPADPELEWQIRETHVPGRTGDVVVVPGPFWTDTAYVATHGSCDSYDAMVPLMFAGRHFRPGEYSLIVDVVDIAPTLARVLGTLPPALGEGQVLAEILQ